MSKTLSYIYKICFTSMFYYIYLCSLLHLYFFQEASYEAQLSTLIIIIISEYIIIECKHICVLSVLDTTQKHYTHVWSECFSNKHLLVSCRCWHLTHIWSYIWLSVGLTSTVTVFLKMLAWPFHKLQYTFAPSVS